ncbi:MAG TPA: peroxidase family protein, partial [Pseudomonas sp.]|nr:peroxidase family protein [Pseudomonas sp.]
NLSMPLVGDIDLAAIDVLRDRERGVPRYNEFRRQIGLNPITKFEDLTQDAATLAELKRLYNNDIEKIDTLVGQLAETVRPDGFAFGETAFQIFIMNASRRLMADRFYTKDYRPEVYTQEGIDWVEHTSMVDVLKRHNPQLSASLAGVENAFKPWGLNIPADYESWPAANKQENLWVNGALRTQYAAGQLPALQPVDIGGLIGSILWSKVKTRGDVAPAGYAKPLHAHGAMAKVKFVAVPNNPYSGLFQGADSGLLRLSVTGDPADRGFAPGLAWKALVDGKPSENVSALYTLSGQGTNHNLFANELSQYVVPEANDTLGTTILFSAVSLKPTLLLPNDMAEVTQTGAVVQTPKAPTQLYFVPRSELRNRFASEAHDFRTDLQTLTAGTKVYDLYATSMEIKNSIFPSISRSYAAQRRSSAVKIGELELTSAFIASAFGDSGVFFKHQRSEDK